MAMRLDIADVNLFHLNHHHSLIVEPELFNLSRRPLPHISNFYIYGFPQFGISDFYIVVDGFLISTSVDF